jgi:type VI secretion system secreted protein Hcp
MAVDSYLELDSIQGESQTEGFKDQIQLHSFSFGGTQRTSVAGTGGSGAGKVDLHDFTIVKNLDKASSKIFKALVSGTHIKSGVLSSVKSGANGKPYFKLTFGELFVTSHQISASDEIPTESVSFSYNTIKVEYSTQNEQGILTPTGSVSYDLKAGKAS